ncbi:hypothetical protein L227DRAFT_585676 [Lentinus tigrinus ALCF2SS1-6]|uniref:SAP domain-containing protein n=1 Tax=Lentinus tigrinus ALCF2SS1-6 TaxID=1328759 RepID=A0A5C2SCH8_9APHY|nr:hypothetical protein L227DRAFT_585676 [Lentinus tigrinus ALCF2SS1-6]
MAATPPDLCTYRGTPASEACGAELWCKRTIRGRIIRFPVRKYLHQSLKHWLGRMLSREDIETWLQRCRNEEAPKLMTDIFDGLALHMFLGPDGKLFLDAPGDELRLIFSLSADGFNPYQMKEAKHNVSKFRDPGVFYRRTALRRAGRRARAAVVPVVGDLLAARQLAGFGSFKHARVLCTLCTVSQDNIESTEFAKFVVRNVDDHREAAMAWKDADSPQEREDLFKATGIRYSELLRLDYWNPPAYLVIDTMHNLYLGLLQRHLRDFWGINPEAADGDASAIEAAPPPARPSDKKMANGEHRLRYSSLSALKRLPKPVLYHMCVDRDLRHAGTSAILAKHLDRWVSISIPSMSYIEFPLPPVDYGGQLTEDVIKAEESLRKGNKATTLVRFRKETLTVMCEYRHLETTGTKPILAARLVQYMAPGSKESMQMGVYDASSAGDDSDDSAIGRDTLDAYLADRARMEVPSWVNPPPVSFGTKRHGKLSADQWRTLSIVYLPVTLIRIWGFQEERRVKMMMNFLYLVETVEIIGLLEIDEERIARAEVVMKQYLDTAKELYKGCKVQPNHHLALHIGVFLRLFGPVHSWRAFVFERFNFFLQSLNTNLTFGDLEVTFMMSSCRQANFTPLLRSPVVSRQMAAFAETLRVMDKDDRRGMRLDAILRSAGAGAATSEATTKTSARKITLTQPEYVALLERLNADSGNKYVDGGRRPVPAGCTALSSMATPCDIITISGVYYKSRSRSQGDSNLLFRHPSLRGTQAGRIERMFTHAGSVAGQSSQETFLVVKRLEELDEEDAAIDPFRKFTPVGGLLYYDAYIERTFVLRAQDVVSHFAKTQMDHLVLWRNAEGHEKLTMKKACVHVRPLDRCSVLERSIGGQLGFDAQFPAIVS